jgi:hypothetical protein
MVRLDRLGEAEADMIIGGVEEETELHERGGGGGGQWGGSKVKGKWTGA